MGLSDQYGLFIRVSTSVRRVYSVVGMISVICFSESEYVSLDAVFPPTNLPSNGGVASIRLSAFISPPSRGRASKRGSQILVIGPLVLNCGR